MKQFTASLLLASALFVATVAAAPSPAAAGKKDAPPAAKEDNYPLKTCVVSGEALGSMGDYVNYVHKEAGKPDRIVRFCCDGCIDDFKKEPARFLKKIDEAAAAAKTANKK